MSHKATILRMLQASSYGILNLDLNPISYRYSARIEELRKEGYDIKTTRVKQGVWKYQLSTQTTPQTETPRSYKMDENQDDLFSQSFTRPIQMPSNWLQLKDKLRRRSYSPQGPEAGSSQRSEQSTADLSLPPLTKDLKHTEGLGQLL